MTVECAVAARSDASRPLEASDHLQASQTGHKLLGFSIQLHINLDHPSIDITGGIGRQHTTLLHKRTDLNHTPQKFALKTSVFTAQTNGLIHPNPSDIRFVNLDSCAHCLACADVHHPFGARSFTHLGMDLQDQAIDGGGELTVRQISQKAEKIGLSLIALALQLNQLLTFFFDQDTRRSTPFGSRGVTADLPLSKRNLRRQASS